jgi:ABC-type Fe3+/spermidine/putrescine transport system ATPase subunit
MTVLSVRGLTVRRGRRTVLQDVSFSAQGGAVTAILGLAGAGKTTLLAAVAGLLPPERGAVFRDGADITALAPRRRDIALLPPGTRLADSKATQSALKPLGGRGCGERLEALLQALRLHPLAKQPAGLLSHGEAFAALAAARLLPPGRVLLVDEAGSGLDGEALQGFAAMLKQDARTGRAVVLATRSPAMALTADHLVLLAEGQVQQTGTPASLYAEPRDADCARLTGLSNVFTGRIRELRPGGFVWTGGGRYLQAADPDMPRPALGGDVTLCLRPERLALLVPDDSADNVLEGEITDFRSAGPLLHLRLATPLGEVLAAIPSWRPRFYPAAGQTVRVGWAADAGWVLP